MTNEALADHLQRISYLFTKAKEPWKSKAFNKVANEIRVTRKPVAMKDGKYVDTIPGVGKAIKDVIEQFAATGDSEKMKKLVALLPEEDVVRFSTSVAKRKVTQLLGDLGIEWYFAGSARRGLKTVKDIDVIVVDDEEGAARMAIADRLYEEALTADVRNGQEKIGVSLPIKSAVKSLTLDLNFCKEETLGAMLLYFTGPKSFNIQMRADVKAKGMRLNQNGLFDDNGNVIAARTEEAIFQALGMRYINPKDRA